MPHAHDGRRRMAHRAESELGFSAVERTRGRSWDPSVSVCRRGIRQRAAGPQAGPAAAPVVTSVPKDPLNHMRIGDIRRRPPAMTRSLPPQCGQRLRAPQRSMANTRLIGVTRRSIQAAVARTTAMSACHRDCFTTTVSRRLFHDEWPRSPARLSARLSARVLRGNWPDDVSDAVQPSAPPHRDASHSVPTVVPYPVIPDQVRTRSGNQGGELRHEVQRLEQHVRRPLAVRVLQLVDHLPSPVPGQPLQFNRRPSARGPVIYRHNPSIRSR